jgi:hypothetical protein
MHSLVWLQLLGWVLGNKFTHSRCKQLNSRISILQYVVTSWQTNKARSRDGCC